MGQCRKVYFGSSKQHMTSWIASVVLFGKIPTLRQNAMTGGPALRFCFAFLQATARAWIPQKPIYKYTHIPITRLRTARHARVSLDAARLHADIQATRGTFPHAALGHARPATPKPASTQHGRVQTSGHTHTSPHHNRPHTARRARVSPDAAQPHADIQATRGMFPHAALCHARPATPQLSLTQHDRTLTP